MDVSKFIELKINNWKDLIDFFEKFKSSENYSRDWIFRGESDASRCISPSLERLFENDLPKMAQAEELSLSHFKRRYRGEFRPNNSLEWLSLMQHYGAPTRLVDFTYSWYIALFFAIESLSEKDASLWCINLRELKNGIILDNIDSQAIHPRVFEAYERNVCCFIDEHSKGNQITIPVEPQLLNERIHIQQGLFLINSSWNTQFNDILFKTLKTDKTKIESKPLNYITPIKVDEVKIFKLVINNEIKKNLIKELFKMNISRETIYPGIEGFAQSIKTKIQAEIYLL